MSRMSHLLSAAGQVAAGIGLILLVLVLSAKGLRSRQETQAPPGWKILRPPHEVSCLAWVGDSVWTGGKDGLIAFDLKTQERKGIAPTPPVFGTVRALLLDHEGGVWVGHDFGLARLFEGQWQVWPSLDRIPFSRALSLLELRDGCLWVGTDRGVFERRGDAWVNAIEDSSLLIDSGDALFQDSRGWIWVGCASASRGGLYCYCGQTWKEYTITDGLPHRSVNTIAEDQRGVVWVATGFSNRGGAGRWNGTGFDALTKKDGLAGEKVRSIMEDPEGRLWFGSEYDGVAILQDGVWDVIKPDEGLAGREVKVVLTDPSGAYWLGTDEGLTWIQSFDAVLKRSPSS